MSVRPPQLLLEKARQCRALAQSGVDDRTREALLDIAGEYESQVAQAERREAYIEPAGETAPAIKIEPSRPQPR